MNSYYHFIINFQKKELRDVLYQLYQISISCPSPHMNSHHANLERNGPEQGDKEDPEQEDKKITICMFMIFIWDYRHQKITICIRFLKGYLFLNAN